METVKISFNHIQISKNTDDTLTLAFVLDGEVVIEQKFGVVLNVGDILDIPSSGYINVEVHYE
jgi:hypothetical protein